MKIVTLDFESYYDKEFSLRKMTPAEYILSPLWECTGLSVKRGSGKSFWVEGDEVQEFFDQESEDCMCVTHNALFDLCICAWRYGWIPRVMVDTLGISRSLLAHKLRSLSLNSVAGYFGLGGKTGALGSVLGLRLDEIRARPQLYQDFKDYGLNDADLCYGVFERTVMTGEFPMSEIAVMDAVLRCCVQPKFVLNLPKLYQSLGEIRQEKDRVLAQAMLVGATGKPDLMSNDRFALLLQMHGVEPPTKISATTGKTTWAFSKGDQEFLDLEEHPSIAVQALVAARLGHKTTLEETRHQRFINIANLSWPRTKVTSGGNLGLMPMPLRFGGAHTHRLSGDWKLNAQNLGRDSMLRESLEAPPEHVVVAGDESQIEARIVCTLAGQEDMRLQFERGEDVYCLFGSDLFGRTITKADKLERFISKTGVLSLGFGAGGEKFSTNLPIQAWNQLGIKMDYSLEEGTKVVNTYRRKNSFIANTWALLNKVGIPTLAGQNEWRWGPVLFRHEEVILPNGMKLYYHNLRQVAGGKFGTEWVFDYGYKIKRLYGGKLFENIVQALARIIVMDAAVRIRMRLAKLGIELALQVHDELVFVVRAEYEHVVRLVLAHELKVRPKWLPELPLDCEIGAGLNYAEAK